MCEALAAANSSGIQPDPTPTLSLPFERWSTVASSAARTPGARNGVSVMLMPIRTFGVFAASQGINGQPVERSDGVEVELLCQAGEIFELLDGHHVAEVRQVESEFHGMASSRCVRGLAGPTLRST